MNRGARTALVVACGGAAASRAAHLGPQPRPGGKSRAGVAVDLPGDGRRPCRAVRGQRMAAPGPAGLAAGGGRRDNRADRVGRVAALGDSNAGHGLECDRPRSLGRSHTDSRSISLRATSELCRRGAGIRVSPDRRSARSQRRWFSRSRTPRSSSPESALKSVYSMLSRATAKRFAAYRGSSRARAAAAVRSRRGTTSPAG